MVRRVHLLGLAHVPTVPEEQACAFTQKVVKLAQMLRTLDYEVLFYGSEDSRVDCSEHIPVLDVKTRVETYGAATWNTHTFDFKETDKPYQVFAENAIREISQRKRATDLLLIPFGSLQKQIADGAKIPLTVESGIGYAGTFATYRVFESYAWMHYLYGMQHLPDGNFYDAVIPNYFDPTAFEYSDLKQDYFLYLGRLIHRKGIAIVKEIAEQTKTKVLLAGPLSEGVDIKSPYLEYVGYADAQKRRELLRDARALLVPTLYVGPFEGVTIEAAFAGTPVITTDWGAFAENVLHGLTGFRCRTLEQFTWAVQNIGKIAPITCRQWAMQNFTMDRVGLMYDEYFTQLLGLLDKGWYTQNLERQNLDWLRRKYPQ